MSWPGRSQPRMGWRRYVRIVLLIGVVTFFVQYVIYRIWGVPAAAVSIVIDAILLVEIERRIK
jgi:hypothetical protein